VKTHSSTDAKLEEATGSGDATDVIYILKQELPLLKPCPSNPPGGIADWSQHTTTIHKQQYHNTLVSSEKRANDVMQLELALRCCGNDIQKGRYRYAMYLQHGLRGDSVRDKMAGWATGMCSAQMQSGMGP